MSLVVEGIGALAACITTFCFVPQVVKVIRTRETESISLIMYAMLVVGIVFWLIYGFLIQSWPLVGANMVSFVLVSVVLGMKLRYG